MKPAKNNIILIDCWQHLTSPLELAAKKTIHSLLNRIEGLSNWHIYEWSGDGQLDQQISHRLTSGNFNVALHFDDPTIIYNTYNLNTVTRYYFCGFHTNHCIFYNTIGIDKYFQLADKSRSQFWIIDDATAASLPDFQAVDPQEIPWYNPTQLDEDTTRIYNYRNQIIKTTCIQSKSIELD